MALPGGASRDLNINLNEKRSNPKAFVEAANDLDKLSRGVDATGDKFDAMASDADKLNVEIAKTKGHIKELSHLFASTQDVTLFGDIRKHESHLRRLQKALEEVTEEAAEAATEVGAELSTGIGKSIAAKPAIIGGLVAVAAAAAPAMGAIIAGAVVGVVGAGGIAGGIFSASKDESVRAAARHFKDSIADEFFGGGQAFVEPTKKALRILEDDFKRLHLDALLADAAPAVEALAVGVGALFKNMRPGLEKVFENAPQIMGIVADGLGDVGTAFSDMLTTMMESEGTMDGLRALFTLTGGVLRGVGNITGFLGDRFHELNFHMAALTEVGADLLGWLPGLGDAFETTNNRAKEWAGIVGEGSEKILVAIDPTKRLAGAVDDVGDEAELSAEQIDALYDAIDRILDESFSLEEAQDAVTDSVKRLKEQLKEQREEGVKGAGSLTGNTRAALDNRDAVRDIARTYEDLMEQYERHGISTDGVVQKFEDTLVSMGFARAEARRYAKELAKVKGALDAIPNKTVKTVQWKVTGSPHSGHSDATLEIKGRARGGSFRDGEMFIAGEEGPELVMAGSAGRVMSHSQTMRALNSGGGGRVQLDVNTTGFSSGLERELVAMLQRRTRAYWAGNSGDALGGKVPLA